MVFDNLLHHSSLLSYLCTIINDSIPLPLVTSILLFNPSSFFILFRRLCSDVLFSPPHHAPYHTHIPPVFRCIIPSPGQAGVRRLAIVRSQLVQNSLGNKISLYALLRLRKLLIETENKPKINLGDFDLFLS